MIISTRHLTAFAVVLSTGAFAGCAVDPSNSTDAATEALTADGNEAVTSSVQQQAISEMAFSTTQLTPSAAAIELSAPPASGTFGAGCATRTQDASNPLVVHIHFNECTGPFGLRHLNGDETAVFSSNPDGSLHVNLSDNGDLTVNGHAVQHSADGDITMAGTTRNVAWKGAWNRQTDAGVTITHTNDLAIAVDTLTDCKTTTGTGVTSVGAREVSTKVESLQICQNATDNACPSGTVVHTAKTSGKTITVDFDGSAVAAVTGPRGHESDVDLVCTP